MAALYVVGRGRPDAAPRIADRRRDHRRSRVHQDGRRDLRAAQRRSVEGPARRRRSRPRSGRPRSAETRDQLLTGRHARRVRALDRRPKRTRRAGRRRRRPAGGSGPRRQRAVDPHPGATARETKVLEQAGGIGAPNWSPDGTIPDVYRRRRRASVTSRRRLTPARRSSTPSPRTTAGQIVRRCRSSGGTPKSRSPAAGAAAALARRRRICSSIARRRTSSGARPLPSPIDGGEPTRRCTRTSTTSSGASPATPAPVAAVAGRQVDRVPQRPRRLGSPLCRCPPAGGAPVQITKGQFEAWRPVVVARQHAHRVRRERARTSPARAISASPTIGARPGAARRSR